MNLGKKLVELRKKQKISQEALAEALGVSRQTISNWELGETVPDINQVVALAKHFEISLDELTGNDVSRIIVSKVSNTEKLALGIIRITKIIGLALFFLTLMFAVYLIFYFINKDPAQDQTTEYQTTYDCELEDEYITLSLSFDEKEKYISLFEYSKPSGKENGITSYEPIKIESGDSLYELYQSLLVMKNIIIEQGGSCK